MHFFKELLNKGVSSISTDALANAYAEAILRFQKAGPYRLLGISFGGLVALETAISLTKLGHEVELVVMLDTILPSKVSYTFSKKIKRLLNKLASKVGKVLTVKQEVNLEKLKKDAYHQALKQYQKMSGEYQGKIVLIKAKDRSEWGDGVGFLEDYGWTELLERRPDVFELAGSHLDIIKPPLSQDVANILQKVSGADK
jgi:thioesterase domain-containing protein